MTVLAEEARLELVALKEALKRQPAKAVQNLEERSDGALSRPTADAVTESLAGPHGDIQDARAMLSSMQDAQKSAVRDVDAVRAKIMEALQTLATVRGDLPTREQGAGAGLSSEDITAWAASMATRLGGPPRTDVD